MVATAGDLLVFVRPRFLGVQFTLGLADEVGLFFLLGDKRPVRIARVSRRVDPEPVPQFDEQLYVFVVIHVAGKLLLELLLILDRVEQGLVGILHFVKVAQIADNSFLRFLLDTALLPVRPCNLLVLDALQY